MKRVRDEEGREWKVRRRWLENGTRLYGSTLMRSSSLPAGLLFLPFLSVFLWTRFFELLFAICGRIFLRRPWTIEATLNAAMMPRVLVWRIPGWRESRRALREACEALARGDEVTSFGEPEHRAAPAPEAPRRYLNDYT